jgi:hypothetical protein
MRTPRGYFVFRPARESLLALTIDAYYSKRKRREGLGAVFNFEQEEYIQIELEVRFVRMRLRCHPDVEHAAPAR